MRRAGFPEIPRKVVPENSSKSRAGFPENSNVKPEIGEKQDPAGGVPNFGFSYGARCYNMRPVEKQDPA